MARDRSVRADVEVGQGRAALPAGVPVDHKRASGEKRGLPRQRFPDDEILWQMPGPIKKGLTKTAQGGGLRRAPGSGPYWRVPDQVPLHEPPLNVPVNERRSEASVALKV